MNYLLPLTLLMFSSALLSGCADRDFLVPFSNDAENPAYAQGGRSSGSAEARMPLDVPPELRGEVEVPNPDKVATGKTGYSAEDKELVAGKAVSLDGRIYSQSAPTIFSAVIDAMTALNMPVQSVDSPSGTVTTDWIRQESVTENAASSAFGGIFGGDTILALRYRFVVRVLRQKSEQGELTRLEIRTIGQVFTNRQWVNRPIKRKVADELFSATEERLNSE